jgi:two-component sensor histidine kinase
MQEALLDFFALDRLQESSHSRSASPQQITIETIFRALDLVPTPILVGMDPASTNIRSNAAGHALFGGGDRNLSQSAAEADRPDFQVYSDGKLVPPNDLAMQRAGLTGQPTRAPECELRFDDGVIKYIRGKAAPVFGRDGTVRGTIGVFMDVTEARNTEKRLALMTEEVKHRARNTLALVLSIASLTLKPKLDTRDYEEFERRLQVIGQSIDVSMANNAPQTVKEVVSATLKRQIGREISRVTMAGPETQVPLQVLSSLSMAIHELTTNACKYGALSVAGGSVLIHWIKMEGTDVLALDWIERGGPKVVPPSQKGFGSRLLAEVLGSPGGKKAGLTFNEQGVECRLYVGLS